MARAAAPPGHRPAGSGSWLRAPALSPPPPLRSQEILAVSLRPAYSALGAARSWEGDGAGPPLPGPGGGKSDPGKRAAPPRRCPWHGGARRRPAPSRFPCSSRAVPPPAPSPSTPPTVPRRLGRRRTPWAQGSAPGAPSGLDTWLAPSR